MALNAGCSPSARIAVRFGGAPLAPVSRRPDDAAAALVAHAYDAGCAISYRAALRPRPLGTAHRRRAARQASRDYLLSTKVGRLLEPRAGAPRDQHGYVDTLPRAALRLRREGRAARSNSLQRLRLTRVDLVYVHDIDHDTHGDAHAQPGRRARRRPAGARRAQGQQDRRLRSRVSDVAIATTGSALSIST
jgi:D-threo-aldose 1-dehydrogenase